VPSQLLPPDHHFPSRENPHGLYRLLRNYLHYPVIFSREAPPAACLPSKPPFEPNLRTILDPSGLPRDQSLATTTKTHRQLDVFPNSHTRQPYVIIHETTSILPCRGGGGGILHSLSPRDIAFSEAQSLHSPFRLQGWGVWLHLFLAGSRGVLRFFGAFEGPFWGFCYEIISWGA
jgi:hypothetical protein